jgi:hypothetical protein
VLVSQCKHVTVRWVKAYVQFLQASETGQAGFALSAFVFSACGHGGHLDGQGCLVPRHFRQLPSTPTTLVNHASTHACTHAHRHSHTLHANAYSDTCAHSDTYLHTHAPMPLHRHNMYPSTNIPWSLQPRDAAARGPSLHFGSCVVASADSSALGCSAPLPPPPSLCHTQTDTHTRDQDDDDTHRKKCIPAYAFEHTGVRDRAAGRCR